ncbi:Suppressor of Sensor Kinase (SLN1), partial [Coemansia sp. RSA 552]
MDTRNEGGTLPPANLRGQTVFLYGYPTAPPGEPGARDIDRPDAYGEELRRQQLARQKLVSGLESLGARIVTQQGGGLPLASLVVIPDDCSAKHQAEALAVGHAVVSETAMLEQVRRLQAASTKAAAPPKPTNPRSAMKKAASRLRKDIASGRLRNSVSLDEMKPPAVVPSDSHPPPDASNAQRMHSTHTYPDINNSAEAVNAAAAGEEEEEVVVPVVSAGAEEAALPVGVSAGDQAEGSVVNNTASEGNGGGSDYEEAAVGGGPFELDDDEHCERTEWHQMLTSALCSQVVDGEKKRLNAQSDSYLFNLSENEYAEHLSEFLQGHEDRSYFKGAHMDLWLGCRGAVRGRKPAEEKQTLESLRAAHVDTTLRAVIDFSAEPVPSDTAGSDENAAPAEFSGQCLAQVQRLLRRVDYVEGMYPTLRSLAEEKPIYASPVLQDKLAAIISWTNVAVRIEGLYKMIQRWTGSSELNLFATANPSAYSSTTAGITSGNPGIVVSSDVITPPADTARKRLQHTPFVERLLKENGMKMIFEQKILAELEQVIQAARRDMIANIDMVCQMGLPVTSRHMQELLLFPPRLLQTCLHIWLQSTENLVNPPLAQIDQLIEDIRDSLSVACRVKRSFTSLAAADGKWNPEIRLDTEYDQTLRSCLHSYFRLVHRKLVITKGSGARDFEILENQWPFLVEIVRDIDGGHYELVLRYCKLVRRSMRIWTGILARRLEGPEGYDAMMSRDLGKWITRALQDIRSPILKAQRLVRTIQNALTNSTDYAFDDPFPVLTHLVDSSHVLVYTSGEWESHGVYIIGTQMLQSKPYVVQEMLSACIVDEVMFSDRYKGCYLLIIRTDAEFNWTGKSVAPAEDIPYLDLELSPGQMRLIAPGLTRLERYRQWLERLKLATKRQPWQTYTAVTDEIIDTLIYSRSRNGGGSSVPNNGTAEASDRGDPRQPSRHSDFAPSEASGRSRIARSANSGWYDEDIDDYDLQNEFEALRPSLEPLDRELARMNSPGWGTAVRRGLIEDMLGTVRSKDRSAPVRIRELNRAHNPHVQKEWTLLKYSITRMLDALTQVPDMLRTLHLDFHERAFYEARNRRGEATGPGGAQQTGDSYGVHSSRHHGPDAANRGGADMICRGASCDLLEQVQEAFLFVSNTSSRGARFLDLKAERYVRLALLHMSVGWCAFIAEDCMANERRTFRWAMQALEFTMSAGKNNTLQVLSRDDWQLLKAQVAGCVTLMIGHFDVMGDRNTDLNVKERQERQKRHEEDLERMEDFRELLSLNGIGANVRAQATQRQRLGHAQDLDELRDKYLLSDKRIGRVLEVTAQPEDETLRLLAASSSNITIRWTLGRYIGGGAFGAVYVGNNSDTGEMMAVKEIRFPSRPFERAGDANRENRAGNKIVREMEVMSMMQHPNIVNYYGIEVHREKVYLFMELCTRGSLAQFVKDQGRLTENQARVFVVQMLRGLAYLHSAGICHRDIKCDNTLLSENMTIKLVDFGAAKVLNQQSLASTRRSRMSKGGGSLTGTPMYMAPEVILGSNGGSMVSAAAATGGGVGGGSSSGGNEAMRPGRLGAQDIWSLGCCIVEMVTGNPPWAHLDNEWAIMYHVVAGNPPLPGTSDISAEGLRFIKRCFTRQPADRPVAVDLMQDEWLASTLRKIDRLESKGQPAGKLVAGPDEYLPGPAEFDSDMELRSTRASHRSELSINTDLDRAGHTRSSSRMLSLSTMGSAASATHSPTRSRKSSIHTKNLEGDLRFMNLAGSMSNAEALLSMMDQPPSVTPQPGGRRRAYSGSDRSAVAGGISDHPAITPGSPGSANSLHAAWPFNKNASISSGNTPDVPVTSPMDLPPVPSATHSVQWSLRDESGGSDHNEPSDRATSPGSTDGLNRTEEDLVAKYSSPSVIYQALNSTSYDVDQPPRQANALDLELAAGSFDSADSAHMSQGSAAESNSQDDDSRGAGEDAAATEDSSDLSKQQIQILSETTRMAVSSLLSMPLEGADVSGVSGWLGEGNTPMELLNSDEIKEAVATASQNV